jgi:hypothetical protein
VIRSFAICSLAPHSVPRYKKYKGYAKKKNANNNEKPVQQRVWTGYGHGHSHGNARGVTVVSGCSSCFKVHSVADVLRQGCPMVPGLGGNTLWVKCP